MKPNYYPQPFIVAELSANHNGSIQRALSIIDAAAEAGADAIKFQTFTPEQMANPGSIIQAGPWAGRDMLDLYKKAHIPREWHGPLFSYAKTRGLVAFSSVFHQDDVDFLETFNCPIYKIASFELTDTGLIYYAANTGKPLIISTGMGTQIEIAVALTAAVTAGATDVTLMKCTSAYPASPVDANLATMMSMAKPWNVASTEGHITPDVGLSDHTLGIGVAVAATALGATVIEKHLTLSRNDGGLDSEFSMEPPEFKQMVVECKRAAASIGGVHYGPTNSEYASLMLRRAPGEKRGQ